VDLNEILYGGDGIVYYLDHIPFYFVSSAIPKWPTFKLLRWELLLNRLMDLGEILNEDDDIEVELDSILINSVALTIPNWWTFKLL
jgi:hypothetical protein